MNVVEKAREDTSRTTRKNKFFRGNSGSKIVDETVRLQLEARAKEQHGTVDGQNNAQDVAS